MSIEKNLERIADALEAIAGSTQVSPKETSSSNMKPAKSPAKKPAKKGSSETSKDDVRDALKALQKAKSAADARQLLADHGAKTLTDLDVDKYDDVIAAAKEAAS